MSILGPSNLPSEVPYHASQMYAKNITTFLLHLVKDGQIDLDHEDEIVSETLITHGGKVVNPRVCELLGIEPPTPPVQTASGDDANSEQEDT